MFPKPSSFLDDQHHDSVCGALVTLARTLHEHTTLDKPTVAGLLGEYLNLWPESIRRDLDATYHQEREAKQAREIAARLSGLLTA